MIAEAPASFLVFSGGNDRAIFGFLRALRLCGQRAHIVARTPDDRVLRSDFRKDVLWVRPTHALTLEIFADCIQHVRAKAGNQPLALLPSTEYFNTFILRHRPAIEGMGCKIPLIDVDLYAQLSEKRSAADFFSRAGVQIPIELFYPNITPPVVAKPIRNVSSSGQSLYPHLLGTQAQLDAFLSDHDTDDFFFQEYVQGDSHYLLFHLSEKRESDVIWSQHNLLQQPGGKSMLLAEGSDFHQSETATRILDALREVRYSGLGMVEVIRHQNRDVFIEMNPRIWGPVQLCVDQGQPLLQAFIGEILYDDPLRFADKLPQRRRTHYFWLGGLLETIASGQAPKRLTPSTSIPLMSPRILGCEVYLRKDSWRCFASDLVNHLKWRTTRERP